VGFEHLVERARSAASHKEWDEKAELWKHVQEQFPETPDAYFAYAEALANLHRLDEAETVLAEAMGRFPEHPGFAIHHGWMAMRRADWTEASRRWAAMRDRFLDQPVAFYEGGLALREAGLLDEADAVLAAGAARFPDNAEVFRHYALNADRRGSRITALARWEDLCRRFPDDARGRLELERARSEARVDASKSIGSFFEDADALAKSGQFDDAEALLFGGMELFPDNPGLAIHHGWMAMRRADWAEAARRWERVRGLFPEQPVAYYEGGLALREAGFLEEAEAVLASGIARFPDNVAMYNHYALNADRRRSWVEALARWEDLCRRFPQDELGKVELQRARYEARLDLADGGDLPGVPAEAGPSAPEAAVADAEKAGDLHASQLLASFESLGNNCEFGYVQRYFGAEPLSLFRWGATTNDMIVSALDMAFDGIGTAENTTVSIYPGGELVVHDKRFFDSMHTHVHRDAVDPDAFLSEMCVRLRFLKRKLIETLEDGDKIFVRRSVDLPDEDAFRLHRALQRFGRNRLMCVRPADEDHPPGTVELLSSDLAVSYVKLEELPLFNPPDHAGWLDICRKVHSLLEQ